ncbi:YggS family pyridoxal phosphate-dependent enzyme [Treponema pectinovorum]|uniref:YggS family pyridoxal phosphate-dependent enzyme n=1 Tax=Treponema pectinovorum TaxID=164 RepID=UPI0011F21F86|nr:YggS family pyridoxal phosphate-dependent enzyme [Treponema pectinovorum]
MLDIKERLNFIKSTLPKNVKLVAVSKFHPEEEIIKALEAGQTVFGENRIQEAEKKFSSLKDKGYSFELHIIGSLQRNKVKQAVKIASMIQSVDRIELLDEIEKQCAKIDKKIQILFEIHTGEESKAGFDSKGDIEIAFKNFENSLYPHIIPRGFMTMAPFTEDEDLIRSAFRKLKMIQEEFSKKYPKYDLSELSMGMSSDYEIALEEGSTMVRIGTAIFGERNYQK